MYEISSSYCRAEAAGFRGRLTRVKLAASRTAPVTWAATVRSHLLIALRALQSSYFAFQRKHLFDVFNNVTVSRVIR